MKLLKKIPDILLYLLAYIIINKTIAYSGIFIFKVFINAWFLEFLAFATLLLFFVFHKKKLSFFKNYLSLLLLGAALSTADVFLMWAESGFEIIDPYTNTPAYEILAESLWISLIGRAIYSTVIAAGALAIKQIKAYHRGEKQRKSRDIFEI